MRMGHVRILGRGNGIVFTDLRHLREIVAHHYKLHKQLNPHVTFYWHVTLCEQYLKWRDGGNGRR